MNGNNTVWSDSLTRILADLRFLAGIQSNQKACFVKKVYVDAASYWGSALRLIYNESGRDCIQRTRTIFHDGMEHFSETSNNDHKEVLFAYIKNAIVGLENLIQTYERSPEVHTYLTTLSNEVHLWIKKNTLTA